MDLFLDYKIVYVETKLQKLSCSFLLTDVEHIYVLNFHIHLFGVYMGKQKLCVNQHI